MTLQETNMANQGYGAQSAINVEKEKRRKESAHRKRSLLFLTRSTYDSPATRFEAWKSVASTYIMTSSKIRKGIPQIEREHKIHKRKSEPNDQCLSSSSHSLFL